MVHRPSRIFTKAWELLSLLPASFASRTSTSYLSMDRYSHNKDEWENQGQYPTQEEIVDPYLNDETVGVPSKDQVTHHEHNVHPSQEEQELEQRDHRSDDAMDQTPGSGGAFNLKITRPGRPSSFDPSGLVSQFPETDKEGGEGGALQPPTMLEFAGLGRNGSVYYKAGPPRRSGALRKPSSRYRAQPRSQEEEDDTSYTTHQIEPEVQGLGDRPPPGHDRLDQQRVSEASLPGGTSQRREEPSSMAHSLTGQTAQSGHYPSAPDTLQPGIGHNPQAAQVSPDFKPIDPPTSSSIRPRSQPGSHPHEHTSPASGSGLSPFLQEQPATVPQVAPQGPPQPVLHPQRHDQTASMPANRSSSPQRTPPQLQQWAPVTPDFTPYAQDAHPPAPVSSQSQRPTNLPGSQTRQSAVPGPQAARSTPSGQQGSRPPQMAGPQQAQDPPQRAAQQQRQNRSPAMVPSQTGQQPSRKPVPPVGRPSQLSPARTQEAATQQPPRGQENYEPHDMRQQQQQQQQLPSSRQQQGARSPAPYNKTLRPEGFQQSQQLLPGNNSRTPMENQQGLQQAYSPPPHEKTPSTPLYEPNPTTRTQRDEQNNNPSQTHGAVEPIIALPQQQPPAEPYGRQQSLTRSPPPRNPTSILNGSTTDVQIPPSSSSTQTPAQIPAPLRVQPRKPASPAPLTGESLLSTLVQGQSVPRLDPKHGSALMEGLYCIL